MKSIEIFTEIDIKSPVNQVTQYVSNPDNAPEWFVNIKSAEWLTPKPLSLGSQFAFTAHFRGRKSTHTYEVLEWKPNEKMVMQTVNGPFLFETIYTWQKVNNGYTHMTLTNKGKTSGLSRLMSPLMASTMKRANKKDLQRLKSILEKMSQ